MSNKARSILKVLAVILVLLAVVMQIGWVIIPSISIYKFWFVVIAFGLLLISSNNILDFRFTILDLSVANF